MYPITTYLVALTCADFDITTETWNYAGHSMPVYGYTLPNDWDSKQVFQQLTIPVLNIYSDAFGIYPFVNEKLANANAGAWGTMEHQTCSFHESFSYYDPTYLAHPRKRPPVVGRHDNLQDFQPYLAQRRHWALTPSRSSMRVFTERKPTSITFTLRSISALVLSMSRIPCTT